MLEISETSETAPLCDLCGKEIEADQLLLVVVPAHVERSKKSGRYKMVEDEFDFKDEAPSLQWHFTCATEELLDPSIVGYDCQFIDRGHSWGIHNRQHTGEE